MHERRVMNCNIKVMNCWELTKLNTLDSVYRRLSGASMRDVLREAKYWKVRVNAKPLKRNKHHFIKAIARATLKFGWENYMSSVKEGAVQTPEIKQVFLIRQMREDLRTRGVNVSHFEKE